MQRDRPIDGSMHPEEFNPRWGQLATGVLTAPSHPTKRGQDFSRPLSYRFRIAMESSNQPRTAFPGNLAGHSSLVNQTMLVEVAPNPPPSFP